MTIFTYGFQKTRVAELEIAGADLPTGVETNLFQLPNGAVVVGGGAAVTTSDTVTTSSVLDVGFKNAGITADPDGFVTALSTVTALAVEVVSANAVKIGQKFPEGATVTATRTVVGANSVVGTYRVWIEYYIAGNADGVGGRAV